MGDLGLIMDQGGWSIVSTAIGVDYLKRIWVIAASRLERENEKIFKNYDMFGKFLRVSGNLNPETDMYKLEIFDEDGILLGEIPLTHHTDDMKIFGDRMFIFDRDRNMCFYEYKIIEK